MMFSRADQYGESRGPDGDLWAVGIAVDTCEAVESASRTCQLSHSPKPLSIRPALIFCGNLDLSARKKRLDILSECKAANRWAAVVSVRDLAAANAGRGERAQ